MVKISGRGHYFKQANSSSPSFFTGSDFDCLFPFCLHPSRLVRNKKELNLFSHFPPLSSEPQRTFDPDRFTVFVMATFFSRNLFLSNAPFFPLGRRTRFTFLQVLPLLVDRGKASLPCTRLHPLPLFFFWFGGVGH